MFVKPSDKEDAINPFRDILVDRDISPLIGELGFSPTVTGSEEFSRVSYCPIPEATFGAPGSAGVFNLTAGSDLIPFTNTAPGIGFSDFLDSFTSHLCAAKGMPIEVSADEVRHQL